MSKKLIFLGSLLGFLICCTLLLDLYVFDNRSYLGSFWLLIAVEMGAIAVLCWIANVVWPGHLTKLLSVCFFLMCGMGIMIEIKNEFIISKQHFIGILLIVLLLGIGTILILYLLLPRPQSEVVEFIPLGEFNGEKEKRKRKISKANWNFIQKT